MSDVVEQSSVPEAERPWMPKGYMKPTTEEKMLKWEDVSELLRGALNYWIATTTKDGRPHVRPVWAVWSRNIIYFDGSPETGWWRNLNRDPRISIQVEVGDIAIIVEGVIVDIAQADDELATRLLGEYNAKYLPKYNYDATDASVGWRKTGLLSFYPRKIFAWDVAEFGTSPTKWTFGDTAQEA
jgi:uncharacterized pyridoxamine 5'-phosphate oxidase family protein